MVAIRPHLVWGPGDPQLVARIVARARAGRLPLIGPGAALVDTTYVDNAVDALLAAAGPGCRDAHGQALVVTNGEPRPVARAARPRSAPPPAYPARAGGSRPAGGRRGLVAEGVWSLRQRRRPSDRTTRR